jgi:hypothetical protein
MSRDYLLGLATIPAVAVVALTGRLMWEYVLGPCMYICPTCQRPQPGPTILHAIRIPGHHVEGDLKRPHLPAGLLLHYMRHARCAKAADRYLIERSRRQGHEWSLYTAFPYLDR